MEWTEVRRLAGMLDSGTNAIALGGHRGMGANVWHPTSSTPIPAIYRENTLKSFQRAVECGATFLEFDVQVCADGVPVIWHDNYVVYGDEFNPISRKIADLTSHEFRQLAPVNHAAPDAAAESELLLGSSPTDSVISVMSVASAASALSAGSNASRLLRKHKNDCPALPCEPTLRSWQCVEEDHFPTLAEVFAGIPANVAFDLEVKMAVPDDVVVTPAAEVDRMVTATLAAVDDGLALYGPRPIMFTSFDPEICTEIKRRRPEAVVMFLSGGGMYPHVDPRRTSSRSAIEFASGAGLQGIVLNTLALQREPQVVDEARRRGLRVMTYGLLNDDPDWVLRQHCLGVQGVIVDDVAGVAGALSGPRP